MEKTEYMTTQDVADLLNVNIFSVYTWLEQGRMRGYKAGAVWRVKKEDAEAFLKSNQGKNHAND